MSNSVLQKAFEIAKKELRACYDEFGIVAGRHHFDEYWTRDAGFACLGAIVLGDFDIVKKQISFWASMQRKDGMISFLSRKFFPGPIYLGLRIKIPLRPRYRSHKAFFLSEVIDSNAYFVIVFSELLKRSEDQSFLERYKSNAEKALLWYLKKMKPGAFLVAEGPIAGWNDGIYKTGKTLITNVLCYKAFKKFEDLCRQYNIEPRAEFVGIASKIKAAIQKKFWNGKYFIDWIDYKGRDYFESRANFLAVIWDVAAKEQAGNIMSFARRNLCNRPFVKTAHPNYPWYRIEILNRFIGIADYASGNGMLWSDTACLFAWALAKTGTKEKALEFLAAFSKNIVKNKGIYEVYSPQDKKPVSRWNYKSEFPYARGSALFILTYEEIMNNKF